MLESNLPMLWINFVLKTLPTSISLVGNRSYFFFCDIVNKKKNFGGCAGEFKHKSSKYESVIFGMNLLHVIPSCTPNMLITYKLFQRYGTLKLWRTWKSVILNTQKLQKVFVLSNRISHSMQSLFNNQSFLIS